MCCLSPHTYRNYGCGAFVMGTTAATDAVIEQYGYGYVLAPNHEYMTVLAWANALLVQSVVLRACLAGDSGWAGQVLFFGDSNCAGDFSFDAIFAYPDPTKRR